VGYLIFSLSLLTTGIARKFITQGGKEKKERERERKRVTWKSERGGICSLGDIFFLNSFAGDYSSAIMALTKRETAQNREERGKVCRHDCLSTFRMGILRRAACDFDEKREEKGEGRDRGRRRNKRSFRIVNAREAASTSFH